jgi:1-acylglycerone phosphate reductase
VYQRPAIEADPAAVRQMFNTNVFGLFEMVTAFTPLLLASVKDKQLPPTIVNVASILARMPLIFGAAYNASKAAVAQYSDTLRLELEHLGVKVVTLYMGEVSTGLMPADNIKFNPDSIYIDFEAKVKDANNKHARETMKTDEFARKVVSQVVVKKPGPSVGEFLWLGTNAWLIWFLNMAGPRKVFDGISQGMVGFNEKSLKQSMLARSQRGKSSA